MRDVNSLILKGIIANNLKVNWRCEWCFKFNRLFNIWLKISLKKNMA